MSDGSAYYMIGDEPLCQDCVQKLEPAQNSGSNRIVGSLTKRRTRSSRRQPKVTRLIIEYETTKYWNVSLLDVFKL
jgi:hypothetical protein